ncbi:hypothetical protein [Chryseobacterium lathyri]|uniref:Uncharacterized protein n=1 Tax=Chryseobacterium lathyri TaxID=395933 RepID=A0ABT9SPS0_9FLAO|nr:hypothetical protein [Chryseobacterium lathyri]MDP9961431.1 hypothetical protein [Chryseobacterium lathyri]
MKTEYRDENFKLKDSPHALRKNSDGMDILYLTKILKISNVILTASLCLPDM